MSKLLEIIDGSALKAISFSGGKRDIMGQLIQINPHINFHSYKNISSTEYAVQHKQLKQIYKEILLLTKSRHKQLLIGLLTHHKDMNKQDWQNFGTLIDFLISQGCEKLSINDMNELIYGE